MHTNIYIYNYAYIYTSIYIYMPVRRYVDGNICDSMYMQTKEHDSLCYLK